MENNIDFNDSGEKIVDIISSAYKFVQENIRWAITEHDLYENINNNIERNNLYVQNIFVGFNENTLNESYLPEPGKSKIIKREGWLSIKIDHIFRQDKIINTVAWIAKLGRNPEYKFEDLYNKLIELRDTSYKFIYQKISKCEKLEKIDLEEFLDNQSKITLKNEQILQRDIKMKNVNNNEIHINFLIYSVIDDIKLPVNIHYISKNNKLEVPIRFQKNLLVINTAN
ncbi:MAG: hypothetical protein CL748_00200 [Chloroflexi bacterium]|nr:hypothetical protein [Chloroflexota bacterium]